MKHLVSTTASLLLAMGAAAQLSNGLIAYYPFNNGNTGNQAPTSFSTLFAQGTTPTSDAAGAADQALAFSGGSAQLWVDSDGLIDFGTTTSFSFTCDFRSGSAASQKFFGDLLANGHGWRIGFFNSNGYVTFESGVGNSLVSIRTTTIYNDQAWHQVALLVDKADLTVRMYVDNVLQELAGTVCGTAVSGTVADIGACNFNANEDNDQLTTFGGGMHGALDQIRLYGRLLTEDEVAEAYALSFLTTALPEAHRPSITGVLEPGSGGIDLSGFGQGSWQVSVLDQQGRVVMDEHVRADRHRLDLGGVADGVYVVRCQQPGVHWTERYVLVR